MPRLVLVVLIALAATADGAPDRVDATIQQLPVLGTIARGRARIVVRGEVSRARARDALALVDQVVGDVQRRFTAPTRAPDRDITLCLLPDDARLRAVALAAFGDTPSDLGFYRPDHRVALANLGNSIGNLRHELVHPLLGDDFPDIPAWLNEGIAALYGSARPGKHGFEFLVNYRLRDLQRALRAGDLPTLAQLAASTSDDVRGPRAMTWYALARYVLLFADRAGKLGELYARLRDAGGDSDAQRAALTAYIDEAAFRRWAAGLRL
jgi:hypothetical protein